MVGRSAAVVLDLSVRSCALTAGGSQAPILSCCCSGLPRGAAGGAGRAGVQRPMSSEVSLRAAAAVLQSLPQPQLPAEAVQAFTHDFARILARNPQGDRGVPAKGGAGLGGADVPG